MGGREGHLIAGGGRRAALIQGSWLKEERMAEFSRLNRRNFLQTAAAAYSALHVPTVGEAQELPPPELADKWVEPGPGFQMDFWSLPRVQFWSFDNRDPVLKLLGYEIEVQVVSTGPDENTFSLHAGSLQQSEVPDGVVVRASQLTTAGQQVLVPGVCEVYAVRRGTSVVVRATATLPGDKVRAIKLVLRRLPTGRVGYTSWESVPNLAPVPVESLALAYPTYQGGAPVWFLATDGERGLGFSSLDVRRGRDGLWLRWSRVAGRAWS